MVVWRYEDFFQTWGQGTYRSFIYEYQVCFAIISVHASNSTWTIRGRHLNHTQHVKTHTSGPKSGSCLPLCIPTTNTPPIGCTKTMRPRNAPFREDGSGTSIRSPLSNGRFGTRPPPSSYTRRFIMTDGKTATQGFAFEIMGERPAIGPNLTRASRSWEARVGRPEIGRHVAEVTPYVLCFPVALQVRDFI